MERRKKSLKVRDGDEERLCTQSDGQSQRQKRWLEAVAVSACLSLVPATA